MATIEDRYILIINVSIWIKKKLKFEVPGSSIKSANKYQLRKSFTHLRIMASAAATLERVYPETAFLVGLDFLMKEGFVKKGVLFMETINTGKCGYLSEDNLVDGLTYSVDFLDGVSVYYIVKKTQELLDVEKRQSDASETFFRLSGEILTFKVEDGVCVAKNCGIFRNPVVMNAISRDVRFKWVDLWTGPALSKLEEETRGTSLVFEG